IPGSGGLDLRGRRIVWLDDTPENNSELMTELSSAGAQVEVATDTESAVELLSNVPPDLLISDVGRGERSDAGVDDLEQLRSDGQYDGPVVFYTARVTGKRRARAKDLKAQGIFSGEDELIRAIYEALPARPVEAESAVGAA